MKPVIIYFSNSGITEKLAKRIGKDVGAKGIKIIPEKEYGGYAVSIAKMIKERITNSTRSFTNDIPDLSGFDTVFVGYPIWGGGAPRILLDFLSQCNISDKTVIPFSTATASGIKGSLDKLKAVCKGCRIRYPFAVTKRNKGDYDEWIKKVMDLN